MGERIVSKIFNYGDENESAWPPKYGTGGAGIYHIDKETHKVVAGLPPREEKLAQAPYVITDTIQPYRHPVTLITVDSRKALADMDKACGTITTDKRIAPDPSRQKEAKRKYKQDGHEALHKAVAQIDAGTAKLTEETRALCELRNETVSKALNFDAFNVVGKKDNEKGKRFRR